VLTPRSPETLGPTCGHNNRHTLRLQRLQLLQQQHFRGGQRRSHSSPRRHRHLRHRRCHRCHRCHRQQQIMLRQPKQSALLQGPDHRLQWSCPIPSSWQQPVRRQHPARARARLQKLTQTKANQPPMPLALLMMGRPQGLSDVLKKRQPTSTLSWILIPSQLTTMAQCMAGGHTGTNAARDVLCGSAVVFVRRETA